MAERLRFKSVKSERSSGLRDLTDRRLRADRLWINEMVEGTRERAGGSKGRSVVTASGGGDSSDCRGVSSER